MIDALFQSDVDGVGLLGDSPTDVVFMDEPVIQPGLDTVVGVVS